MYVRLLGCLLLLATATLAQEKKKTPPGPFDVPPPGMGGWPGVRARYHEELQRCKARLERNAADAGALERALTLCNELGRTHLLVATARKAVAAKNADEGAHRINRGVLGQTLIAQSNTMGMRGNIIRIVNGRVIQGGVELSDEQKKLLNEAVEHLRAAVKKDRTRPALRYALADALVSLQDDPEAENLEANRLRDEAQAIVIRDERADVALGPYAKEAERLIRQAQLKEQVSKDPDHTSALELRKKALVLWFCRDTIVFDNAPPLYSPVSMLAPRDLVFDTLTRTFQNRVGETAEVAPNYHAASLQKKLGIIQALGKEQTNGADATLLALIRGSKSTYDALADEAARVLADEGHGAARRGLPLLLAKAINAMDQQRFPQQGQRRLVDLAAAMGVPEAAGVLAVALVHDVDVRWPRGVAHAIGRVGTAEHADALKKRALDSGRAICFRREAARAFALLALERAGELDGRPELEIAVAAARYEKAPDESTLGRLLNGFANDLEVDEAARYCAELRVAEAGPAIDAFLRKYGEKRDHPARLVVERAKQRLSAEG